jgi:hypothetical protein
MHVSADVGHDRVQRFLAHHPIVREQGRGQFHDGQLRFELRDPRLDQLARIRARAAGELAAGDPVLLRPIVIRPRVAAA